MAKEMAKEKVSPLSEAEREDLADLERRANMGRQDFQPAPAEMLRLGKLRERAKAKAVDKATDE